MTHFPGNDLIMDVARAANPAKQQVAVRRLSEIAAASGSSPVSFSKELAAIADTSARTEPALSTHSPLLKVQISSEGGAPSARKVARQFEAFLLQTFIEQVLPSEQTGLFGDHAAGGIWRSLMAEQIGATFANAGGIGLAKTLEQQLGKHAAERDAASAKKAQAV